MMLWLSDARGVYIPRDFVESFDDFDKRVKGVTAEDKATLLQGPDAEFYWEAWDNVLANAVVTDENGIEYTVYQESDCWLVPKGMEWNDKNETFEWPDESEDEDSGE
jgi:hypothetical protein